MSDDENIELNNEISMLDEGEEADSGEGSGIDLEASSAGEGDTDDDEDEDDDTDEDEDEDEDTDTDEDKKAGDNDDDDDDDDDDDENDEDDSETEDDESTDKPNKAAVCGGCTPPSEKSSQSKATSGVGLPDTKGDPHTATLCEGAPVSRRGRTASEAFDGELFLYPIAEEASNHGTATTSPEPVPSVWSTTAKAFKSLNDAVVLQDGAIVDGPAKANGFPKLPDSFTTADLTWLAQRAPEITTAPCRYIAAVKTGCGYYIMPKKKEEGLLRALLKQKNVKKVSLVSICEINNDPLFCPGRIADYFARSTAPAKVCRDNTPTEVLLCMSTDLLVATEAAAAKRKEVAAQKKETNNPTPRLVGNTNPTPKGQKSAGSEVIKKANVFKIDSTPKKPKGVALSGGISTNPKPSKKAGAVHAKTVTPGKPARKRAAEQDDEVVEVGKVILNPKVTEVINQKEIKKERTSAKKRRTVPLVEVESMLPAVERKLEAEMIGEGVIKITASFSSLRQASAFLETARIHGAYAT